MEVLQKYTSKNSRAHLLKLKNSLLLKLLRHMTYFAVKFNFNFSAVHVEGKLNPKADCVITFPISGIQRVIPVSRRRSNRYRPYLVQRLTSPALDSHWHYLISSGLTKSTNLTYSSGQRLFIDICLDFGTLNADDSILPASEIALLAAFHLEITNRQR